MIITLSDDIYEVEIIDSTHLKMRAIGFKWGIPLHFQQVRDEVIDLLREKNFVKGNFFIKEEICPQCDSDFGKQCSCFTKERL